MLMGELDANRIAAAALAIADDRGVQGFSMRAVAETLGVTPMALYHHVKDKAALAALVVDSAIRERPLPAPTGEWQDDLLAMAKWSRANMVSHPVVGHLRREFDVWTPSMLSVTERWLDLWQQSGLATNEASRAAIASSMAITGLVHEEMLFNTLRKPNAVVLSKLPNIRELFATKPQPEAQFTLTVQSLIEGLHARLSKQSGKNKSKPTRAAARKTKSSKQ
jgi:AcrR family transcriptional regulator